MWRFKSLQTRFILVVVLSLLIPGIITAIYNAGQVTQSLRDLVNTNNLQLVTNNAKSVENLLLQERNDLLFLTQSSEIRRFVNAPTSAQYEQNLISATAYLRTFLNRQSGNYVAACLMNVSGDEVACLRWTDDRLLTMQPEDLVNRVEEDYFTEPLSLTGIPGQETPVYVSNMTYPDDAGASDMPVVRFSTLLQTDSGRLAGVLMLEASTQPILDVIDCADVCNAFYLVDVDGRYLLSSSELPQANFLDRYPTSAPAVLGQTSGIDSMSTTGDEVLRAFARIRPSGQGNVQWTLIYEQPVSGLVGQVWDAQFVILGITVAATAVALVVALLLGRSIFAPVHNLAVAADQITHDNWDVNIPDTKRVDEIGTLTNTFQMMRDRVRERIQALEVAQEKIRESESINRAILGAIPDLMFRATVDGVYLDVHASNEGDLYVPKDQIIGRTVQSLMPEPIATLLLEKMSLASRTNTVQTCDYTLPINGATEAFEARFARLADDTVLTMVRNVTTLREAQSALENANADLEERVAERTAELSAANQRLQVEVEQRQQAENELVSSNYRLVKILSRLPVAVIVTSMIDSRNLYINDAAMAMLGINLNVHSALGHPTMYYADPADRVKIIEEILAEGYIHEREVMLKTRAGKEFWVLYSAQRMTYSGEDAVLVGMIDITERREAEAATRRSEAQFRLLTDKASDLICLHDPDGTYRYVSPSSHSMLGYRPSKLVGRSPYTFFHPDDLALIRENHDTALEVLEAQSMTYRYRRKDGTYIWLETYTRAATNTAGEVVHLVTISRDVTQRRALEKRLRESEQFVTTALDSLAANIAILNQTGEIVKVNEAWRRFARENGADRATTEGVGLNYLRISESSEHPTGLHIASGIRDVVRGVLDTFYHEYDLTEASIPGKDSDEADQLWFSMRVNRFDYQGETHVIVAHTDITERKIIEQGIIDALDKERELSQLRTQFVSMVSHEFRTPLATIMTTADILQRHHDRFSMSERRERLGRIQNTVHHLTQLLDDIIYIGRSQIGEVPFVPQETDLEALLNDMVTDVQLAFNVTGKVKFQYLAETRFAHVDPTLIHRIVMNLLSNAIKYAPDGDVTFTVNQHEDNLTMVIKDQGIGIPKGDQFRLFNTFYRASNVGSISGTGLGLVIVKEAVEAHKGQITFESVEGEGTTFYITLKGYLFSENGSTPPAE